MTDQSLQTPNSETSAPAEDVKQEVAEGEIKAPEGEAQAEAPKEGEQPKAEPTEAEKVKMAMQKRIDRQTAALRAAEQQLRQLQEQQAQAQTKVPNADSAPKQDDYKTYDEWEQATIEWKANQKVEERLKEYEKEKLKTAQERQQIEHRKVFEQKEASFRTIAQDYDSVAAEAVAELSTLSQSGVNIVPLRDMVMTFDNPPAMLYQLGQNPNLIEKLVAMPPMQAMRELIKLETAAEAVKPARKQAPEPINTPTQKGGGSKTLSNMSPDEILAWAKGKK